MKCLLASACAALFAAVPAHAQLSAAVGPDPAPLGAPISVALSNDTDETHFTGVCYYEVAKADGTPVFKFSFCIKIAVVLAPGWSHVVQWNQLDSEGEPVPPGDYLVTVYLPDNTQVVESLTIGGTETGLTLEGAPHHGTSRTLRLVAPELPGLPYFAAASLSPTPGIPTCGGTLPLALDDLFLFSLGSNSAVFQNFAGVLDASGESTAPRVSLPKDPDLIGQSITFAFGVLDPAGPCPVADVSPPLTLVIE